MGANRQGVGDAPQPPFLVNVSSLIAPVIFGAVLGGCCGCSPEKAAGQNPRDLAAIAKQLWYERLPSYRQRMDPLSIVAVTSDGREFIGTDLVDVETKAFAESSGAGLFIGNIFGIEPQ